MGTRKHSAKRGFGSIRRLPSGNYQARYVGPDLERHTALTTFSTRADAEGWLAVERRAISAGTWQPPTRKTEPAPVLTFGAYAEKWIDRRLSKGQPLRPRTRAHYQRLLALRLVPSFGDVPLDTITPSAVRAWFDAQPTDSPTMRAHAYQLLRTILSTAVEEELIATNPCRIPGGQRVETAHKTQPATLDELACIVEHTPERYQLLVLLGAWCALRFGELTELRRKDVDLERGVIRVRRGVVRVPGADGHGATLTGPPKSRAGVRDVAVPPHVQPLLADHLRRFALWGPDGLLFVSPTGAQLAQSTFYRHWLRAVTAAGRPDLRGHDLRHTGGVLAAQTGATLAELMARLGHASPAAAMRYQHAAAERDRLIADRLSQLAGGVS